MRIILLFVMFICLLDVRQTLLADYPNYAFCKHVYQYGRIEPIELKDGVDLSDKNLSSNSFHRRLGELRDINFDKSILNWSSLEETTFVNCSFRGTKMYRVDASDTGFFDCDFTDAEISHATFCDLQPENLIQTANYKRRDLSNTSIISGGYRSRSVSKLTFDFSRFNLENTYLPENVAGADFTDARIRGATLTGLGIAQAGSIRKPTEFFPSFIKEQLYTTSDYRFGVLIGVKFQSVDFRNVDFRRMNLTDCVFVRTDNRAHPNPRTHVSDLLEADLTDAVISGCDFTGTKNLTVAQIQSTWNYKVDRMEGIKLPKEIQDALDAEKETKKDVK